MLVVFFPRGWQTYSDAMIQIRTAGFRCHMNSISPWSSASYNTGLLQVATWLAGKKTENAKSFTFNETEHGCSSCCSSFRFYIIHIWGPNCTYVDRLINIFAVATTVILFTYRHLIWDCLCHEVRYNNGSRILHVKHSSCAFLYSSNSTVEKLLLANRNFKITQNLHRRLFMCLTF